MNNTLKKFSSGDMVTPIDNTGTLKEGVSYFVEEAVIGQILVSHNPYWHSDANLRLATINDIQEKGK